MTNHKGQGKLKNDCKYLLKTIQISVYRFKCITKMKDLKRHLMKQKVRPGSLRCQF